MTSPPDLVAQMAERLHHSSAPIRTSFTDAGRDDASGNATPSALAKVLRGTSGRRGAGRGGGTRLAVLLTLLWVLRGGDHSADRPARFWATLAGLDDPEGNGGRAVRDSLSALHARDLVDYANFSDRPKVSYVRLLREDGSGKPYSSPVAHAPGEPVPQQYFRIPASMWEDGMLGRLSGPGLAIYVISMRILRTDNQEARVWISPDSFRERFGLSEGTRKEGFRELVRQGIVTESQQVIDSSGGAGYRRFRRKVYTFDDRYRP